MHFESCHLNYLGNYSKLVTWCHLGLPTLLSYNKGHKNFIDIHLSAHILIQFLQIIIDANSKYSSKLHFSYLNENTKTSLRRRNLIFKILFALGYQIILAGLNLSSNSSYVKIQEYKSVKVDMQKSDSRIEKRKGRRTTGIYDIYYRLLSPKAWKQNPGKNPKNTSPSGLERGRIMWSCCVRQ